MKISELPFIIKKNITIKQTFDIKNNFFLEYRSANNPLGYSLTKIVKLYTDRSEEHTSELQSRFDLVCRLLLEKKKNINEKTCNALEKKQILIKPQQK